MDAEMKLNARLIRKLREDRAWSQDHLAAAAGLSLRTVQRIEAEGNAAPESRMALAAALQVDAATLVAIAEPATTPDAMPSPLVAAEVQRVESPAARIERRALASSRPSAGLIIGTAAGIIGANLGVASAWIAASQGAHSSAELGITQGVLATIYGLTCAALATMWNRFRQQS